ncbi:outer-membrane lipoprotein carrier protein LolA [Microvirga tunisiensis]|uniref:Outer membrane lipoprotein carrier protein LolA n=1 Tax=Microvirga tunisiensis TaxID=2108360 RepID=A0A5N7MF47_9HYPH|nr:outer-membrane lipoprotein carrier protein LolA [Microvirga tunisiensis]MPR07009.1 outer membrane lipoprotein carrier protein LolA [Microvirga tunisiensis]MPR25300.1 outer membrane lipoprotein carrier protein LolA [Microvirga tunisiensis]
MRPVPLASLVTALFAGALPAMAQTLPIEMILPPARPAATQGFSPSPPHLPTASFHRATPETQPSRPVIPRPANAEQVVAVTAPLPPSRPVMAETHEAPEPQPIAIAPKPIVTAAMGPVALRQPLPNDVVVERANAYFTNLSTLVADFTQVGGDGRRQGGTLYLQRPGKVRFEYDPPATLQVIADGRSVAVRDRKLATQDLYSISQTPLKFLLRERVNLGQDIRITGIINDGDSVRINLEDSSTLGGTSRIALYFDSQVESLNQWRIVDAQGFQTVVVLGRIERGRRIDQDLFKIQYEALVGGNK